MTIRKTRKLTFIVLLLLLGISTLFATLVEEPITQETISIQKAQILELARIIDQLNTAEEEKRTAFEEVENLYGEQYFAELAALEASEPFIWETDAQFEERIEEESRKLYFEAVDRSLADSQLDTLPYKIEIDELYRQLNQVTFGLGQSQTIVLERNEFLNAGVYLRNNRIWPITITIPETIIPSFTLTALVDFAGPTRPETEIRQAIVEFDTLVRAGNLVAKIEYSIIPAYLTTPSGVLTPRFMMVLHRLSIHNERNEILYTRLLERPLWQYVLMVSENYSIVIDEHPPITKPEPYVHTNTSGREWEIPVDFLPLILLNPDESLNESYEQDRLSSLDIPSLIPEKDRSSISDKFFGSGVFRITNGAEPDSIDPSLIQGVPEHRIYMALFEGLVAADPKTGNATPGVAESWVSNADGTQWTFKLRKNAVWSDGKPITAHDVVWSWLHILDPATGGPYAWFPAMFLVGAEEFNEGRASASTVGIRALDNYTFQVDLLGPLPYFIDALTHYSFAILPQHAIEGYGSAWTDPANFVGNGPFVLSDRVPETSVTTTKNLTYWDADNVALEKVIFYSSDSNTTNYNMYLNGDIDWATNVPTYQIAAAEMRDDFHKAPMLATYYYVFQTERAPLNDPLVRKALSYSVDREKLINEVIQSGQIPAWGIVPEMAGYQALEMPFSNMDEAIEKAQKMLAQAGYPNGAGFPTVSILYNTDEGHKQIAQFIQREWRNNLGINAALKNQEWGTYLYNRNVSDFQISRAGWIGDYQDPNTFLDMFVTGTEMNGGKYSNEIYDTLINEAARVTNPIDRFSVFNTAEDIMINEDQAIMNLYYYVTLNMIDTNKWGGWYPNTMDYHPVKSIYLK